MFCLTNAPPPQQNALLPIFDAFKSTSGQSHLLSNNLAINHYPAIVSSFIYRPWLDNRWQRLDSVMALGKYTALPVFFQKLSCIILCSYKSCENNQRKEEKNKMKPSHVSAILKPTATTSVTKLLNIDVNGKYLIAILISVATCFGGISIHPLFIVYSISLNQHCCSFKISAVNSKSHHWDTYRI